MNTMQLFSALVFSGICAGNAFANPILSGVTVRQRWPWSRLVDIDFLVSDATEPFDVTVQAWNGSKALSLPSESLSGCYGVSTNDGAHRIVFDPFKTAYTNSEVLTNFRVALAATNAPLYMIVDLTKSAGADGQIEYIYPGDARLETYGRFTNVWFGVTNDSVYATDKLVLRRVHAGTFKMGDTVPPKISTTLTKDFYVGVFEVTGAQWQRIMGGTSGATSLLAKVSVKYDTIRGATNNVPPINWYTTGSAVDPASFVGQIRTKTGNRSFDLPTEAQWEYFCRAGTTSYYNDGVSTSSSDTNILNRLGWWSGNSENALHAVGGKESNAWGIYDTHGNAWEWCLDWQDTLAGGSDPLGAVSGSGRVRRGGSMGNSAATCRSAYRENSAPSYENNSIGLRLVRTLP